MMAVTADDEDDPARGAIGPLVEATGADVIKPGSRAMPMGVSQPKATKCPGHYYRNGSRASGRASPHGLRQHL